MRFCMVTTFYPPFHFGGDAIYVRALSRALVSAGHEVEVIHCEDAYRLANKSEPESSIGTDDGIIVHRLRSRFGPLSPILTQQTGRPVLKKRALESILSRDFDVTNFHNISLIGGPGVLKMSLSPVTLYTLHEHWLLCPTHVFWKNRSKLCDKSQCLRCCLRSGIAPQFWRYTGFLQRALSQVDAFFSPSPYTAKRHHAINPALPIHVLPLFTDIEPGKDRANQRPSRPNFLYVGRITASKGILSLLKTFEEQPEYTIKLIGDGELRQPLERHYADNATIQFLGTVSRAELANHYRDATAVILPSIAPETFGLIVIEAFAFGTPVIARDSGGSAELIDTTGGGTVYRHDKELSGILHSLVTDPQLREILGKRGHSGFKKYFTKDQHLTKYLGHIEKIQKTKGIDAI